MNQKSPLGDKKKFALNLTLFGALIALTFVVLLWGSDLPALWAVIRRADPLYLLLGLLCMFAFVSCEACNTHLVLGSLGKKLPFGHCLQSAFVGFYFSSIPPSATGGQPAQVYYMQRDKVPLSLASLNFLLITVCYQAVMLGYGGAMFLLQRDFVSQNVKGIGILLVYGIAVNGLCIVGITCAMFSHKLVRRFCYFVLRLLCRLRLCKHFEETAARLDSQLEQYREGAAHIRRHPTVLLRVLLYTVAQLTALYLVPVCVYKALGLSGYSALQILAVQALLTVAVSSLPLPGAVGAQEGGFVTLFRLFFGAELVLPAMLMSRGISFYAFLLISGGVSMAVHIQFLKHRQRQRAEVRAEG